MPAAATFTGRRARALTALAVLVGMAAYLVVHLTTGGGPAPSCTALRSGDDGPYVLDPEQAANAATISAVASARRLPERAVTIALATAMQESRLRNISHGDRDSLGLFQQRPSQGWGTEEQILDPVFAASAFYTHLERIPGYTRMPLTEAAQEVQRSGYPDAYAKHESSAALLSAALTGRKGASFSCTVAAADDRPGDMALLRRKLAREFGPGVLPEPAGSAEGSAGASRGDGGRELVLPVGGTPGKGADGGNRENEENGGNGEGRNRGKDGRVGKGAGRGWGVAHWAVAHAPKLHIEQVSYRGRKWRADDSGKGWSKESPAAASGDPAVRIVTAK